jgi:hypothetical protein
MAMQSETTTNTRRPKQKPRILVVDDDPFTAALVAEVLDLEGYSVSRERDTRLAFDFLRHCAQSHIVFVRYVGRFDRQKFDWYERLVKTLRLQRHTYIETWRSMERPEDEKYRPIQKQFSIAHLPCPHTVDELIDLTESACARLARHF